jgi:hypothetical protein
MIGEYVGNFPYKRSTRSLIVAHIRDTHELRIDKSIAPLASRFYDIEA